MKHGEGAFFRTLALFIVSCGCAHAQLIVHEWGTMTTMHAADGRAQGHMNLLDHEDALPPFVHHFEPRQEGAVWFAPFIKGARTSGRADVTMRLETPVIYFYDRAGTVAARPFDVRVRMRGGLLNDFYPQATATLTRKAGLAAHPIRLDQTWTGSLAWSGIRLDASEVIPKTNARVWLAPRQVTAARISVRQEGEHYLFYRGLANLPALLTTRHSRRSVQLDTPTDKAWVPADGAMVSRIWLVDVRSDGAVAFTTQGPVAITRSGADQTIEIARFGAHQYSVAQRTALRTSMKSELTAAGLFADEAEAMLNTWDASYFGQPGLRIFHMVPRAWTDYFLPLEMSVPHEATRVLVGRIDLKTADDTT